MAMREPEPFPFRLLPEDFGTPVRLYAPHCPVRRILLPSGDPARLVLGHDEVEQVLKDRRFSRNFRYPGAPRLTAVDDMATVPEAIVNLDPPEHTRLRRTIQWAFRPGNAASWKPAVERVATELLGQVIAAGPPADLVESYARPLPIRVITELVDVPAGDQERLVGWTSVFFATSPVSAASRAEAAGQFLAYIDELVAERRAALSGAGSHPARPPEGLLDALIRACDAAGTLSEGELRQMVAALFIGGQENTSAILARGIYTLLRHPEAYQALTDEPELLDSAVEEILRFEVPSEGAFLRVATEDVELPSGLVPRGTAVQVSLPSANRDREPFTDPDRFDVKRARNPHLTFGAGPHFCVGAPLARLELRTALGAIIARLPGLRLDDEAASLEYTQDSLVRALLRLPVSWPG